MHDLAQDVRLAIRRLTRDTAFTATVVATLALGIGLATAVLAVANAILLRPLPVRDQDRVFLVAGETSDGTIDRFPVSIPGFEAFARDSRALESVGAYAYGGAAPVTVLEGATTFRLERALVSGGFFDVLGVRPVLGRALRPDDDVLGADPVVVLSYSVWRRHYGGDPNILGRSLDVHEDGRRYTVVGVMPQGLDYPRHVEAWITLRGALTETALAGVPVNMIGRLRDGAAPVQARDEMTAVFEHDESAFVRDAHGVVRSLPDLISGDVRPAVLAFGGAAALLLLIACANVANLLLMRGLRDARNVAVRVALGAARGRVVRHRLVEHTVLAGLGGVGGALVGASALALFRSYAPAGLPRLDEIVIDRSLFLAAVAVSAAATLLCGVLPALWAARVDPQRVLRSDSKQSASRGSRWVREGLVAAQVALSVAVLSAATLIGRSLLRLEGVDLRLKTEGLMVAELAFRKDATETAQSEGVALEALMEQVARLPGVSGVSTAVAPPYAEVAWDGRLAPEGQPIEDGAGNPLVNLEVVTPDYFRTVGVPVLRGRPFDESDRTGADPVVIITERAAATYWPGQDPVGKRLLQGPGSTRRTLTVVGVVPETRYRDLRTARPSVYFPLSQNFFPFAPTNLLIRTTRTPQDLRAELRRVLASAGPEIALADVAPFEVFTAESLAQPRMNALLLLVFAGASLGLAAIGVFAVLLAMVRQRTKELGVRIALGASAFQVKRLVWLRGMGLAVVGSALGLGAAVALDRTLSALLFETTPTEPASLALTALAVLAASGAACAIPALSTRRIHPMDALRSD